MQHYLQNLLPRLRQFSESLDKKEMLINQPWILTGDIPNKQQFIFHRDGRLIQSVNGEVETGTWEYIAAAQSLLIQSNSVNLLLNHAFFDKGVLLLKKDGSSDTPWILANKNIIPDLDVESYLKKLVAKKQQLGWLRLDSGEEIEFEDPFSSGIKQGSAVKLNGSSVPDGTYKTQNNNLILTIHDSTVTRLISKTVYSTDKGNITIHEIMELDPAIRKGLEVWSGQYPAANGRYTFNDDEINAKYIDVQNGMISKVKYGINEGVVATLLVFGVLFFFLLIFMIFGAQHQ
jgi:hypothetical protein